MTKNLTWHKLSDKKKAILRGIKNKVLVLGSGYVDQKVIRNIVKDLPAKHTLIFGSIQNEWLPGLEGSEQFRPLPLQTLEKHLDLAKSKKQVAVLKYLTEHTKYIIRELKPSKVIWVRGSWNRVVHYNEAYWEAVNNDIEVELISPFKDEESAKKYSSNIQQQNIAKFEKIWKAAQKKKVKPTIIKELVDQAKKLSWDWAGQTGAVITKNSMLVAYGFNEVMPYPGAILHEGNLREIHRAPIGERLEYYQTNHAEINVLLRATELGYKPSELDLYTSKFPCPFCARILANSKIKSINYIEEYYNELGYEVLKAVGKKVRKI